MSLNLTSFVYILAVILLNNSGKTRALLSKCCPLGAQLRIQNGSAVNCVQSTNLTGWELYNIDSSSNETRLPHCDFKVKRLFEESLDFTELSGCFDIADDGHFYAAYCIFEPTNGVHRLNKCCPTGHSYDHNARFCVPNARSHQHFGELFGADAVIFLPKVPSCADDEVFAEYHSTAHNITFVDRTMKITTDNFPAGESLQTHKYCIDGLVNGDDKAYEHHIIVRSCRPQSVCDKIPCIRRCCESDQMLQRNAKTRMAECVQHPNSTNFVPTFYEAGSSMDVNATQDYAHVKEYGVLHSMHCRKFKLDKHSPNERYGLHTDGKLHINNLMYSVDDYCVEFTKMEAIELTTFVCQAKEPKVYDKFYVYPIGLLISCAFLAITLIVYLSLPKLLNLHGKTLVCYILSLMSAFSTLAYIQLNSKEKPSLCFEMAFVILFSLMATFCWQTIMCIDIWLRIGSFNSSYNMLSTQQNHRRFIYFSIYGWGMPMIWTVFTLLVTKYDILPAAWTPNVGQTTCFLSRKLHWNSYLLFYVLPASIHVAINLVLFIIATIQCNRVQREIRRMQCQTSKREKFTALKAIFTMNMELFIVMGVTWILDFVSDYFDNQIVELLLDICNIYRGVLIFLIFVCKRRVLCEMIRRVETFLTTTNARSDVSMVAMHTDDTSSPAYTNHQPHRKSNDNDQLSSATGLISIA